MEVSTNNQVLQDLLNDKIGPNYQNPGGGDPGGNPGGGNPDGNPGGGDPGGNPGGGDPGGNPGGGDLGGQIDWNAASKGLFKTKEDFESFIPDFQEYQTKKQRLAEVYEEIENPIPETLRGKAAVMRSLGIQDETLASKIYGASEETLAKDPIAALAIVEHLENKEIDFDTIYNALVEEYGYQGVDDDGKYIAQDNKTNALTYKFKKAISEIEKIKTEKLSQNNSIFAIREAQKQEMQAKVAAAKTAWEDPKAVEAISNKLVVPVKNSNFEYEVDQTEYQSIRTQVVERMIQNGRTPDAGAIAEANEIARNAYILSNINNIVASAINVTEPLLKQEANEFFHNIGTIDRSQNPPSRGQNKTKSEQVLDYINQNT